MIRRLLQRTEDSFIKVILFAIVLLWVSLIVGLGVESYHVNQVKLEIEELRTTTDFNNTQINELNSEYLNNLVSMRDHINDYAISIDDAVMQKVITDRLDPNLQDLFKLEIAILAMKMSYPSISELEGMKDIEQSNLNISDRLRILKSDNAYIEDRISELAESL